MQVHRSQRRHLPTQVAQQYPAQGFVGRIRVARHAGAKWVAPGQQAGARRRTDAAAGVVVAKAHAGLGQAVNVRRANRLAAVAAEVAVAQVIGVDDDDIGLLGFGIDEAQRLERRTLWIRSVEIVHGTAFEQQKSLGTQSCGARCGSGRPCHFLQQAASVDAVICHVDLLAWWRAQRQVASAEKPRGFFWFFASQAAMAFSSRAAISG